MGNLADRLTHRRRNVSQSDGNPHLDPGDELGDVTAHQFGEGSRHGVVLVSPGQPVDHDHVGVGLALVEGGHELGHPALEHPRYLRSHTERLFRCSHVPGVSSSVTLIVLGAALISFPGEEPGRY